MAYGKSSAKNTGFEPYSIELHQHRFAAWAACRAASVVNCRFGVEQGRAILETCGFTASLCRPEQLPDPQVYDDAHRQWRVEIIRAAKSHGLPFTHGVAAKLVNIYLKSRFVCGGHHGHFRVQNLHPPIDSVLLRKLAEADCGGYTREWKRAAKTRWSKFGSNDYEQVIAVIRLALKGSPPVDDRRALERESVSCLGRPRRSTPGGRWCVSPSVRGHMIAPNGH